MSTYLNSELVRARYGGISDVTLWRWLRDPAMKFPQPRVINRRRYFAAEDLDAFDQRNVGGA